MVTILVDSVCKLLIYLQVCCLHFSNSTYYILQILSLSAQRRLMGASPKSILAFIFGYRYCYWYWILVLISGYMYSKGLWVSRGDLPVCLPDLQILELVLNIGIYSKGRWAGRGDCPACLTDLRILVLVSIPIYWILVFIQRDDEQA